MTTIDPRVARMLHDSNEIEEALGGGVSLNETRPAGDSLVRFSNYNQLVKRVFRLEQIVVALLRDRQ